MKGEGAVARRSGAHRPQPALQRLTEPVRHRASRIGDLLQQYLGWRTSVPHSATAADVMAIAETLLSHRGEASGAALAAHLLERFEALSPAEQAEVFSLLADRMGIDQAAFARAFADHATAPSVATTRRMTALAEPARQALLRRINLAPGGTAGLIRMRERLLPLVTSGSPFELVDDDFVHLLTSWFNPGFLKMRRITWASPADLLERLIKYEAVHSIQGWDDLRRRLAPPDRRCYGFFHPSLVGEPLIFVEVALTTHVPDSIQHVLDAERTAGTAENASVAVFYSISNCQIGLRGISFGNFLIKRVVEDLKRELPDIRQFVTLSPVPGFRRWVDRQLADPLSPFLHDGVRARMAPLGDMAWLGDPDAESTLKPALSTLCARYFLDAKTAGGLPVDPVARFHLGNGAKLARLDWLGDRSTKGMAESYGMMVNYQYDLANVEDNHEAYVRDGRIAAADAVVALAKTSV